MMDGTSLDGSVSMHKSVFILTLKLILMLSLTDFVYVFVFLTMADALSPVSFHHMDYFLLLLHIIKSVLQIALILNIVFRWLYHTYDIVGSDKKLVERNGFFHTKEKVFDLKNLRDIKIEQTVFGQLFRYGNIVINTSASGVTKKLLC